MKSFKTLEKVLFVFLLIGLLRPLAWAQEARITYPQDNQPVRGEITARFEGIPDGGYAIVQVDNQFKTATADNTFTINTFPPNFPGDGPHKLTITTLNSAGKQVGRAEVTFRIANNEIDTGAEGVRLRHWTIQDRLDDKVQRYWIDATSNATIDDGSGGMGGGGGGGGMPGMGGGGGGEQTEQWIPAPLDFQVRALVRRVVRDVGMVDGAANIRSVVDRAYERQRESEAGKAGEGGVPGMGGPAAAPGAAPKKAKKKGAAAPSAPVKAPWGEWGPAPETGQYFVKMVLPTGEEINATRKEPTIALGDLLPTFPPGEVRPGNTWDTTMTFVGELQSRGPVNVQTRITFTSFENITTPAGEQRRCAKLEARFSMPEEQAMKIAQAIASKAGTGTGGAGGGADPGAGGAGPLVNTGGATEETEANISVARTRVSRVLWFDIERRRVLRSEDIVDTYYEEEAPETGEGGMPGGVPGMPGGGAMPGGAGGEGGMASGPKKVTYNLRIVSWLDDTEPPPTNTYNRGVGTAHAKDSVQDPTVKARP